MMIATEEECTEAGRYFQRTRGSANASNRARGPSKCYFSTRGELVWNLLDTSTDCDSSKICMCRNPALWDPTNRPTGDPTDAPTAVPTLPTPSPSTGPTTPTPTEEPTEEPIEEPTSEPTYGDPSEEPTRHPTRSPTTRPSHVPSDEPTMAPTDPTYYPSVAPSDAPTGEPVQEPTDAPAPTLWPTEMPTQCTPGTRIGTCNDPTRLVQHVSVCGPDGYWLSDPETCGFCLIGAETPFNPDWVIGEDRYSSLWDCRQERCMAARDRCCHSKAACLSCEWCIDVPPLNMVDLDAPCNAQRGSNFSTCDYHNRRFICENRPHPLDPSMGTWNRNTRWCLCQPGTYGDCEGAYPNRRRRYCSGGYWQDAEYAEVCNPPTEQPTFEPTGPEFCRENGSTEEVCVGFPGCEWYEGACDLFQFRCSTASERQCTEANGCWLMSDGCRDAGEDPCGQHEDERSCGRGDGCQWAGRGRSALCKTPMTLYTHSAGPRCSDGRIIATLEACQESLELLEIAQFVLEEVRELAENANYPPGCFYGLVDGRPTATYNAWADAEAWEEARVEQDVPDLGTSCDAGFNPEVEYCICDYGTGAKEKKLSKGARKLGKKIGKFDKKYRKLEKNLRKANQSLEEVCEDIEDPDTCDRSARRDLARREEYLAEQAEMAAENAVNVAAVAEIEAILRAIEEQANPPQPAPVPDPSGDEPPAEEGEQADAADDM